MSTSERVQSLPLWVIIPAAVFLVLFVLSPIFIGFLLERRRTAPARAAERKGTERWIETGELDLKKVREEERRRDRYRLLNEDTAIDSAPVQIIQDDRPTLVLPAAPRRELEMAPVAGYSPYLGAPPTAVEVWRSEDGEVEVFDFLQVFGPESDWSDQEPCGICSGRGCPDCQGDDEPPAWARNDTAEWDLGAILEAEIVDTETEAERLFWADPLGSWTLPPEREAPEFLPLADRAFWALVNANKLSGEGANIDTLYTPLFTDHELEEVYA